MARIFPSTEQAGTTTSTSGLCTTVVISMLYQFNSTKKENVNVTKKENEKETKKDATHRRCGLPPQNTIFISLEKFFLRFSQCVND